MERVFTGIDGIPGHACGGYSLFAAAIEIAVELQTFIGCKFGEEPPDEVKGDVVCNPPTIFGAVGFRLESGFLIQHDGL